MMRRTLTVLFAATLLLAPVWSATLLRRGLADDPPECPANQKYQPEVNLGCPRSCDQPTPLCKNWPVGPGCGCPKFTVLAGTSRPRTPQRCIDPRDCLRIDPLCPDGAYPLDRPSECGPSGKPCPEGSFCNTDPIDRFAVCCPDPDDVPPPSPPQCVVTGCNGEVCTDHPNDITTICVVPSCMDLVAGIPARKKRTTNGVWWIATAAMISRLSNIVEGIRTTQRFHAAAAGIRHKVV